MSLDVMTFGESMAMFYANEAGGLHEASSFSKALAGAETNVAVGLSRLGFRVGWMSKVGADSLGTFILNELKKKASTFLKSNAPQTGRRAYCSSQRLKAETLMSHIIGADQPQAR